VTDTKPGRERNIEQGVANVVRVGGLSRLAADEPRHGRGRDRPGCAVRG
jgi:hypothetical protein